MKIILSSTLFLTFFCAHNALAQVQNCVELKNLIDATYNFKPSKITEEQRNEKSNKMDAVWQKVKGDPKNFLPCLREEIRLRTNDNFFRFDASSLLIQIDRSDESKKILIDSYAKVDFNDIDLRYWMPYIAALGYEGFDTSAAGESWLRHPKSEYYVSPQHGTLSVNKEIGALIIYGSMDESIATPVLIRIAVQESHPARENAVRLLMLQATTESFQALKKINQKNISEDTRQSLNSLLTKSEILTPREGAPKISRQQYLDAFQKLIDGKPQDFLKLATEVSDGEKDAVAVLKREDIPVVRKARRFFAATANPHSADWYKSFTEILITLIRKSETTGKK